MKSVMNHNFSQIPSVQIPRSVFNRSHGHKTTFNAGYLIPIYWDEVLPGDTFKMNATVFARLATPVVPIMDNLYLDTFYFFIPNRLLWEHWENFMGNNPEGQVSDWLAPVVTCAESHYVDSGTIGDYFGLPISTCDYSVSALPFRAYNLVYNEWFRQQDIMNEAIVNIDDGPDYIEDYHLFRRGKRHDYFTSALKWPQKGPGVELPLGTLAPVIGNTQAMTFTDGTETLTFGKGDTSGLGISATHDGGLAKGVSWDPGIGSTYMKRAIGLTTNPLNSGLVADLTNATAATINSLREAFQLQRMLERDARGGTRYTEILRSHFGVISPDSRLQRPEYLGGSSARININAVQQTSATVTGGTTPQGNLAAYGVVSDSRGGFNKSFVEHGIILGLANVRADLTYSQGINRSLLRRTRYEYYWPSLAHLGEQEVLNKEIFNDSVSPTGIFGYQERFAEYRYYPSKITGYLRSNTYDPDDSLDVWHLCQSFQTCPTLTHDFLVENPPIERCIAVPTEPHFIFDSYFDLRCARPMPVYSVPGLIDHF